VDEFLLTNEFLDVNQSARKSLGIAGKLWGCCVGLGSKRDDIVLEDIV
jgi:hypothetical protein